MFNKNEKVIDVRLIASSSLLVQILKLISHLQYYLNNCKKEEIVLTLRIRNPYKLKLLASIDDKALNPLPSVKDLIIGE